MNLDDIIRKIDLAYIDSKINGEVISDNVALWLRRIVEDIEHVTEQMKFDTEETDSAYERGYEDGHSVGEEVGYEKGYAEGYDEGREDAVEDSRN